jgi:hypothetical protein
VSIQSAFQQATKDAVYGAQPGLRLFPLEQIPFLNDTAAAADAARDGIEMLKAYIQWWVSSPSLAMLVHAGIAGGITAAAFYGKRLSEGIADEHLARIQQEMI